jgi:alanine racemase
MRIRRREFCGILAGAAASAALAPEWPPSLAAAAQQRAEHWDPWIELDRASLLWNVRQIQQRVGGKPVMAVVKANGYGHGLVETAKALAAAGIEHFLVGKFEEARALRQAGIGGMILNFGPFRDVDADEVIRLGISQNVYDDRIELLSRAASRARRPAHVHVKVDTGLGRFGVHHEKALEFLSGAASLPNIALDGVFTTLTEDSDFDREQLGRFRALCDAAAGRGIRVGLRHAASSAAICDFPAAYEQLDLVRPGILLYGLYPSARAEAERKIEVKPVLSLKVRIAQVKALAAGESVGYHRAYVAQQPERVATLPVGYSDGYPRRLAGKGEVLIGGKRCPIIAISANATLVRLGDAPAAAGDVAVLIGAQGGDAITASEIGRLTESSVYAIAMELSPLVPRLAV